MSDAPAEQPTLFGHPTGLYTLFFAEMWERFSYYGMRALLVLYMIKGFLSYDDADAYKIYGAYTAMVYMTPFFGGMLADRLLGQRRAVVLGGLLMAAGHLLMTWESEIPFLCALALLIVGNGFFKPNISTIVGSLYEEGSPKRDAGFTLFYIGINLGAAMAPLLCGYVGETYGWHFGFGLATVGMMVGLAVFVVPTRLAQVLILGGGLATAAAMVAIQDNFLLLLVNGFVALALIASSISAFAALNRGGLPPEAGGAPDPELLRKPIFGIPAEFLVYGGSFLFVPVFAALVWSNRVIKVIPDAVLEPLTSSDATLVHLAGTLLGEVSTLPGLLLTVTGLIGFGYLFWESIRSVKIERERLWVVLIMMFFSMLFWAFFEQAGSSVNNFTDRNVDRVTEARVLTSDDVGTTLKLRVQARPTDDSLAELPLLHQEQLGYSLNGTPFTMTALTEVREAASAEDPTADSLVVDWPVTQEHVGMGVGGTVVPASTFQSANPIYILIFGLVFTGLWGFLGSRNMEPSTPVKFSLGLAQLGLGFLVMWYGASTHDPRGMVGMSWLLIGYLLHTTGELCLSPVGLSMVTKLSPKRLVSTAMGAWFLATAFSSFLAAIIATFTGVSHGGGGEGIPVPIETVMVYGDVFKVIGIAALVAAGILLAMSPILKKWMHGVDEAHPATQTDEAAQGAH